MDKKGYLLPVLIIFGVVGVGPVFSSENIALAYAAAQAEVARADIDKGRAIASISGSIRRADGSRLVYHFIKPPTSRYPIFLYLDGSSCKSVTHVLSYFEPFVSFGLGALTLEKKGVKPGDAGDACTKEYLRTNDRQQRVSDVKLLISASRRIFPGWDGRLAILGASEGGVIAPEIAFFYDHTIALISFAGGGWSQSEELKKIKEKELAGSGATPDSIREALAQLDAKFGEIRKAPLSTQTWLGSDSTYKRWASYLWYSPLEFLTKLQMPVYVAHGTRDQSVPIESADAIQEKFISLGKTNLTYRRYDDLDHSWNDPQGNNQAPKVISDLLDWLKQRPN